MAMNAFSIPRVRSLESALDDIDRIVESVFVEWQRDDDLRDMLEDLSARIRQRAEAVTRVEFPPDATLSAMVKFYQNNPNALFSAEVLQLLDIAGGGESPK